MSTLPQEHTGLEETSYLASEYQEELRVQSRGACPALGLPMDALAQHTHREDTFHLGSVTLTAGPWRISLVTPSCWQAVGPAWQNICNSNQHHPVTGVFPIYPHKAGSLCLTFRQAPQDLMRPMRTRYVGFRLSASAQSGCVCLEGLNTACQKKKKMASGL